MSPFLVFYVLFGVAVAVLENRLFNLDFTDCSARDRAYMIAQQIVHYARIVVVWPLYVAEELLIWFDNMGSTE